MGDHTAIEWTEASWNPLTGCDKVSDGCTQCYAESIAHRFDGTPAYPNGFAVTLRPERLDQPMRWRRPRRIFVNSMSDLFHDQVPDEYIAHVFAVMQSCAAHTFQVLTKRHARMRSLLSSDGFWSAVSDFGSIVMAQKPSRDQLWPDHGQKHGFLPNVWLGVSAEDHRWFEIRSAALKLTPASVRFISAEPLLGPYRDVDLTGIDWVITGGESGHGARPMHPQWVRDIRDQCQAAGVAFLHKQNGEWIEDVTIRPAEPEFGIDEPYRLLNIPPDHKNPKRCVMHLGGGTALTPDNPFNPFRAGHPGWTAMRRVGKKAAGRELDGRTWDQYPEAVSCVQ